MKVKTAVFFALVFGFFLAVCMLLFGCGPECAPAFPTVGNYEGEPGHYSFHATNRLSSGALLETSRPWLVDEIDQVASETLACATAIGPTLTKEEMDFDHGFCIAHMARNLWCDVETCLRIKITEEFHVSKIDGVTLLLNDVAGDAKSCHPKPSMDPEAPFYWASGIQYDGLIVTPPPSSWIIGGEEGVYGRWGALRRSLVDYVLGCYNSPLVERLQPCLNGMVVDVTREQI